MRWLVPLLFACSAPSESPPLLDPLDLRPASPVRPRTEAGCLSSDGYPPFGVVREDGSLTARVRSSVAERVVIELFEAADGEVVRTVELARSGEVFEQTFPVAERGPLYYGLRVWGPPPADPSRLLIDPYALELSHDPFTDVDVKGVVLERRVRPCWSRPEIPLSASVIYEVHVRGFTKNDPSVPEMWRGTYRGAAEKAPYLASLGVTAIELLPIHETHNDQNDRTEDADGDNYWGYASWSFFAPDRRYAFDKSPGGPTREVQAMVRAFHAAGVEVLVDVVYNHTAEGHDVRSWRGVDDAAYYEPGDTPGSYANHNGVGPNLNVSHPYAQDLVVDSLIYMRDVLGFDGFRFDLAAVLGNQCTQTCFEFGHEGLLTRLRDLEVDLIAEPWGIGPGTYQIGNFPEGWAEWNGVFRDTMRRDQNRLGIEQVAPRDLARRLLGSEDLFGDRLAINYIASHDGFTLRDVYTYDEKVNGRGWPYGPSPGGDDHNFSWNQGGDPARQQQAARTGLALVMLSAGVPMITGGDEWFRTQHGNNNPFNLDSPANWLDRASRDEGFLETSRRLIMLRHELPDLRSRSGSLLQDDGALATDGYLDDPSRHFIGVHRGDTYVAYNGWNQALNVSLPEGRWIRSIDTSESLPRDTPVDGSRYLLQPRSVAVFVRR